MKYGQIIMHKDKEKQLKTAIKKSGIRGKMYDIGDDMADMYIDWLRQGSKNEKKFT